MPSFQDDMLIHSKQVKVFLGEVKDTKIELDTAARVISTEIAMSVEKFKSEAMIYGTEAGIVGSKIKEVRI